MNDGPGICNSVTDVTGIRELKDKIARITPQFCVIGKLFEPVVPDTKIVKSSKKGIMQHALISWGIDHGSLLLADNYLPESEWICEAMDT